MTLSTYYKNQILPQKNTSECVACLIDFINSILNHMEDNIVSIILYGGLVRDGKSLAGWSDIDLIIVFNNILERNPELLSSLISDIEKKHNSRLDITQIELTDIANPIFFQHCYWSDILNVLSNRLSVSQILYGSLPLIEISQDQEKKAAIFYINNTIGIFRRFLTEFAYKNENEKDLALTIPRLIRWTFSIVRASLRLFGIFVHPYEDSIATVEKMFPEIEISTLKKLCKIRNKSINCKINFFLIKEIETFVETYTKYILLRYNDYEKTN